MSQRVRQVARGARQADRIRHQVGRELRDARLGAGLSQRRLADATAISASEICRIEAGERVTVSIDRLARLFAALGMDLSVRAFPVGSPIRDAGHVRLIGRFRDRIAAGAWSWRAEVPVAGAGDLRAWDGVLSRHGLLIATEMETRLHDVQAMQRRIELKRRDGSIDRILLVVADTRTNRMAIDAAGALLAATFPVSARTALAALAAGRDPEGDALIVL